MEGREIRLQRSTPCYASENATKAMGSMDDEQYDAIRKEMLSGFLKAMLSASAAEIDGERVALVNATIAADAIVHLLAAILESRSDIKTRKDMREASQSVEKRLRQGIESLRAEYERTGRRFMPIIHVN